jgi:hypothetical protein
LAAGSGVQAAHASAKTGNSKLFMIITMCHGSADA